MSLSNMYEPIGEEPENKKMDYCIFITFTTLFIGGITGLIYLHYH